MQVRPTLRCEIPLALALALSAVAGATVAQTLVQPTPQQQVYVPTERVMDEEEAAAAPDEQAPRETGAAQQAEDAPVDERDLGALEATYGPYDHRVGEHLLGLGLAYKAEGNLTGAVEVLKRALQISRVNEGLHNLNQLSILDVLIDTNTALGDWQALNQNYQHLYWVSRRGYGADDPRLQPVAERIGLWHLQAYNLDSEKAAYGHLLDAAALFETAVRIIDVNYGPQDQRLLGPLYGLALSQLHAVAHLQSSADYDTFNSAYRSGITRSNQFDADLQRQEAILRGYRVGKEALARVVAIDDDLKSHAIALAHLGDWYLMFNRSQSAMKTYGEAYQVTQQGGDAQQDNITAYFERPRALPAMRVPPLPGEDEALENASYVVTSFDVSENGRVRNIQIIETNPDGAQALARRTKRSLAATKFRPRFENGKPVATTGVKLRYIYPD
jgi:tetratricopeptide (TPR) repeat protein